MREYNTVALINVISLGNVFAFRDIRIGIDQGEGSSFFDKFRRYTKHKQWFRQAWESRCEKYPVKGSNEIHRRYQSYYISLQSFVSSQYHNYISYRITDLRLSYSNRINSLDELLNMGLYLNDLNPHGMSKELVLAGWQHCGRYKFLYSQLMEQCYVT